MWPIVLKVSTLVVLMVMVYDDLKHRSIRVFLFPLLLLALIGMTPGVDSIESILIKALLNIAFLGFILLVSYLFLFLWRGRKISPFTSYFGAGDLIFLVCISFWFEPPAYVLFNTASFLFALVMHQLLRGFSQYEGASVPLVGYQGMCFAILILSGVDFNSWMQW